MEQAALQAEKANTVDYMYQHHDTAVTRLDGKTRTETFRIAMTHGRGCRRGSFGVHRT